MVYINGMKKSKFHVKPRVQCPECYLWFDTTQACGAHIFWKHQYRGKDGKPKVYFDPMPMGSDGKPKMPANIAKLMRGDDSVPILLIDLTAKKKIKYWKDGKYV